MRYRRALILAVALAALLIVGVRYVSADEGDYNSNPSYCQHASMLDPLYYWYECWKPAPPDWSAAS